ATSRPLGVSQPFHCQCPGGSDARSPMNWACANAMACSPCSEIADQPGTAKYPPSGEFGLSDMGPGLKLGCVKDSNILGDQRSGPVAEGEAREVATPTPGDRAAAQPTGEHGGREGLDPTRYGDWEKNGRCIDF